ncbi:ankyrin repeat domain-containing protein [Roseobacter weihaiensis]|uniref:ankyrin repeat domain-containing protein n=1 Tax=Roseobacter weihaiensis TaxID=2763262 RepID=UPI001D0A0A23|nr:ankyrin repeat domain-containing protein [Roseobacter sp. H9]
MPFAPMQEHWPRLRTIIATTFLSVSACYADDLRIAEAFATFEKAELLRFLSTKTEADVSQYRYARGQNVVHAALVNASNPDAIRIAVQYSADLDHQDADGRTPLHHAIDGNATTEASILLDLGARLDLPNASGLTAVSFCEGVLRDQPDHATCKIVKSQ